MDDGYGRTKTDKLFNHTRPDIAPWSTLELLEDPRFVALHGTVSTRSSVLEGAFRCNGYDSGRTAAQRIWIASLTDHQLMR